MSIIKTFNNIANNSVNPNLGPENLDVTPVQASGCMLWLDSSDSSTVILENNKVSQWNDKSGNGFDATQPTEANRPTYISSIQNNLNSIYLDNNSANFLTTNITGKMSNTSQSYTMFVAFQRTQAHAGSNTSSVLFGGRSSGCFGAALYFEQHTTGFARLRLYVSGPDQIFSSNIQSSPKSDPIVATVTKQDGNIYSGRISSVVNFTDVVLNNASARALLGTIGSSCDGVVPFGGYIHEILLFDYVMSDDEKSKWEKYLSNKWGLGIYKPISGHPDVKNWIDRVYANSGTISQKIVDYVTDFCYKIDNAGLRNKFMRLNLMCGNNIRACATPLYIGPNLKDGFGFNSDLLSYTGSNLPFTNNDYIESGPNAGLTGRYTTTNNNSGPGFRTGITLGRIKEFLSQNNFYTRTTGIRNTYETFHGAIFCKELTTQRGTANLFGAYSLTGAEARFGCGLSLLRTLGGFSLGIFAASTSFFYHYPNKGLYLHNIKSTNFSASASTNYVELDFFAGKDLYYRYGSNLGPFPNPNTDIEIFCENRLTSTSNTPVTSSSLNRSTQTLQGYSLGLGLNEQEVITYYDILNEFQNKLGRGLENTTNSIIDYETELVSDSLITIKGDNQFFTIFRDSTTAISLNNFATVEQGQRYRIVWFVSANRGVASFGADIRQTGSAIPNSPSVGPTVGWGSAIFTARSTGTISLSPPNAGVDFDLDYVSVRKINNSNINTSISSSLDTISHPDARDWLSRVYENGGSVSLSTATAVQNLCNSIDAAGLRSLFYRLNLFCGDNLRACFTPLYRGPSLGSPYGYKVDLSFLDNFLESDYDENSGLQGDGISKGLSTGVLVYDLGLDFHLSTYVIVPNLTNNSCPDIAGWNSNTSLNQIGLTNVIFPPERYVFVCYSASNTPYTSVIQANYTAGFYIGSCFTDSAKIYKNGAITASTTNTGNTRVLQGYHPITVLAMSDATTDKLRNFSPSKLASYSCGLAMTDQQASDFNIIMQTFQTALNRNV